MKNKNTKNTNIIKRVHIDAIISILRANNNYYEWKSSSTPIINSILCYNSNNHHYNKSTIILHTWERNTLIGITSIKLNVELTPIEWKSLSVAYDNLISKTKHVQE